MRMPASYWSLVEEVLGEEQVHCVEEMYQEVDGKLADCHAELVVVGAEGSDPLPQLSAEVEPVEAVPGVDGLVPVLAVVDVVRLQSADPGYLELDRVESAHLADPAECLAGVQEEGLAEQCL